MSADNPTSTDETDKPPPPKPVPAETNDSADAYDPDPDELADEALSEPPVNYDQDPVPASRQDAGDSQGSAPAASGGGYEQDQSGQESAGAVGAPAAQDQGGPQAPAPEAGGSLEQAGNQPADGGADVYDPDPDELADEALSEPPVNYDEDPAPLRAPAAAPVDDAGRGHGTPESGAGESGTESAAPERPGGGNGQQQDSQPAPAGARPDRDTEAGAEDDANSKPGRDPAADSTPAPQPPASDASSTEAPDQDPASSADTAEPASGPPPAAEAVTEQAPEPGSQDVPAEAAVLTSQGDDIPAASPANASSETPEEPQTPSAERPEPPVVPAAVEATDSQEPAAAEEAPAPGQREEAAAVAEPVTGDDSEPEGTAAAEAEPVQAGTTEHDPQTQDPEPAAGQETSEAPPHLEGDEEGGSYGDVSWATIPEEVRTPGDTTPTGTGLKPSGEELLDGEGERRNRLDRMLDTLVERGDDVRDASSAMGAAIENDVHPLPNPTGHSGSQQPASGPELHWSGESDAIGSTVLMGVVVATAASHGIRRLIEHGKAHQS
jgi:hypothetical protein